MPSVLIVDDNDQMRRLIRSVIDGIAAPIYDCEDGSQALSVCVRHKPDCVLMDIEMPIMDGLSATQQIMGALPSTTIVIVTQYDDKRMRLKAMEVGARGYVLKENLLELRTLLQTLAQDTRSGDNGDLIRDP